LFIPVRLPLDEGFEDYCWFDLNPKLAEGWLYFDASWVEGRPPILLPTELLLPIISTAD